MLSPARLTSFRFVYIHLNIQRPSLLFQQSTIYLIAIAYEPFATVFLYCTSTESDNSAAKMSQDTGLFSVRRPREVSLFARRRPSALIEVADSRWPQLQLSNPPASICPQTVKLDIKHQRKSSTPHLESCALRLFVAHVPRSQPPTTALFPTIFIRDWPCRFWSPFNGPKKLVV